VTGAPDVTHGPVVARRSVFRLQDDIARRVVEALSLPLGGGMTSPALDTPPGRSRLRALPAPANELARTYEGLPPARDLYQRCLELDPTLRSRMGPPRSLPPASSARFINPTPDSEARAEDAFRRALELNPRLVGRA